MSKTRVVTDRLWIEEGEVRQGLIAEVAPIFHTDHTYSFTVPSIIESSITVGQRVKVPLGRGGRPAIGFVVQLTHGPWDSTLRPIESLVDPAAYLTPELIELGRDIAEHYGCRLGLVLKAMTPEAVRKQRGLKTIRSISLLRSLEEVENSGIRLGPKRRAVIEALAANRQPLRWDDLLKRSGASDVVVRGLAKEGVIEIIRQKVLEELADEPLPLLEPNFTLTDEQAAALEQVRQRLGEQRFSATLLFGVSGSGKTEVYIHAIRSVLDAGSQAILLVPEIMLTTQLVGRLASRLPHVAVSHSGLSEAQRSVLWRQVASGEKRVVIGTRSAVFSPFPRLGLICVDEEQEGSYKNLQTPRFHVRDVAIMRAKQLGIPVVLGSATPSLEVWHNSEHHRDYTRVNIRRRVLELPMPKVHVVDMRDEHLELRGPLLLSRLMSRLLTQTLERKEQALILMNRRGFAQRVFCPACNTRLTCPHCSVGLVAHAAGGHSMCHYCRTRIATPSHCANLHCGHALVTVGMGTQRIEELLKTKFPQARIQRVDSDTMRHRRDYQATIDRFADRQLDVLVGTQMIAKGLDFPAVTFVGILDADAAGLSADFRAHERLFQLVTQTAGRAGRADAGGAVVVQTMNPTLPALRCALKHDYESFVADELPLRRTIGLPPFRRLTRFLLTHKREESARKEAQALADRIRERIAALPIDGADVLGPNACVIPRLRSEYRYDVLLRTPNASSMRQVLRVLQEGNELRVRTAALVIDVDPVSFV